VSLIAKIRADAHASLSFTDEDVREALGLDDDASIGPAEVQEYIEESGEIDPDWDIVDIDDVDDLEVSYVRTERISLVPPSFVPLPGLEGAL
jgi:hypothetical protein